VRDTSGVKSLAFLLVAAIGCGPKATRPPEDPHGHLTRPADGTETSKGDPSCPLLVPGTSISVEDTADGPSLVFVTTGDVAAVRQRGAALAAMHNDRKGPPMAMGLMFSPGPQAVTADVDGGVRVTFKSTDPTKDRAVGDELRMHGHHLAGAASCEMH
jgi:hypothetical protein